MRFREVTYSNLIFTLGLLMRLTRGMEKVWAYNYLGLINSWIMGVSKFENYTGPTADPWPACWLVPPIQVDQVDQVVLVDQAVQVDQASALVVQPVALG